MNSIYVYIYIYIYIYIYGVLFTYFHVLILQQNYADLASDPNPISLKGQMENEKSSWNLVIKGTCVLCNAVVTANGFRGKLSSQLDHLIEIQNLYQSATIGHD